eukprot:EG_transcript_6588
MPNHLRAPDVIETCVNVGVLKAHMSIVDMLIRGFYAGFFAGITASFTYQLTAYTGNPVVGGIVFFAAFMMIIFYGFELVTGNMLLLSVALMARRVPWLGCIKNLIVVYIANFIGAICYMAIFYGCFTYFGEIDGSEVKQGPTVISTGISKTVAYYNHGGLGWAACYLKAIICNFLVGFGMMGSMISTSTTGKVVACWFPVAMFAILGYEHVVINMYTVSCSMALGSGVSQWQFWGWSLAPSCLGNFTGALLAAVPMWITQGHEYRAKQRDAKRAEGKLGDEESNGLMQSEVEVEVEMPTHINAGSFAQEDPEELMNNHSFGGPRVRTTPNVTHY